MSRPAHVPDSAVDITDYGAVSNPDDPDARTAARNLSAIRQAANAAGAQGAIYVPEGTYYWGNDDRNLMLTFNEGSLEPPGISMYGDGPEESALALTEHLPDDHIHDGFRYHSGSNHGEVTISNIRLDGNYENLGDLAGNGTGSRGIVFLDGDNDTLNLENVHFRGWYNNAVRATGPGGVAESCTFEETGIGVVNDTHSSDDQSGRGSVGQHVAPRPADDRTYTFENCHFKNSSGTAVNVGRNDGHVILQTCYIEGSGIGGFKLSAGKRVEVRNTYIQIQNDWIAENIPDFFNGRWLAHKFNERGDELLTFELQDVEVRDCSLFGINISSSGPSMGLEGDNIAFHNISIAGHRDAVLRENNGGEFRNVDIGRISVHDSNGRVFSASNSNGRVETLHRQNTNGLGDTGDISVDTDNEGGEAFQPDVPSREEVGVNASGDTGGDDGDEDEAEPEPEPEPDEPLFEEWSPQWESSYDDWRVVPDTEYTGEHALAFEHDGSDRTRYALSWDSVGEPADIEVLDKFRVPEFTPEDGLGFHARVFVRSSGSAGSESGYWLELEDRSDAFRLAKYTNGGMETLAHFGTPAENTFFYRRFRAEGNELKAKVWPVGEAEPEGWDVEVTDDDHADGWVGLGSFDTGLVETDVFHVATDGGTAPLPDGEEPLAEVDLAVETSDPSDVTDSSATLVGDLTTLSGTDEATVGFEMRAAGDDSWDRAGEQTTDSTGEFSEEATGLDAETEYEVRAVATAESETDTGDVVTLTTDSSDDGNEDEDEDEEEDGGDEPAVPSIDEFDIRDYSNDEWTQFNVDWTVSDGDGELDTVVTELQKGGHTVKARSTPVYGDSASYTHVLRVRGGVDAVQLTVSDTENRVSSETTEL